MPSRTVTPKVIQTGWHRSSGYGYHYLFDGAPWIPGRTASDVPTPQHVLDLIQFESNKHAVTTVQAGADTVTIFPVVTAVQMEVLPGGTYWSILVQWYDNPQFQGTPMTSEGSVFQPSDYFSATHAAHVASIEAGIPPQAKRPTHDGQPHMPGTGPQPTTGQPTIGGKP